MPRKKQTKPEDVMMDGYDVNDVAKPRGGAPTTIKIDDDLQLTAFDQKFIHFILAGYTKTDAAIKAGSTSKTPNKTGWATFQKPNVQEALSRAQKVRLEAMAIDSKYVIENLMMVVAEGIATKKLSDSVKALELIGKDIGMFHNIPKEAGKKTKDEGLKGGESKEEVKDDLNKWLKALPDDILNQKKS